MKRIITFFLLLPLLISAMDSMRGPAIHSTSDLIKTRHYVDTIKAMPAIDLLKKIDSLQSENTFHVVIPTIIQELKDENAQLNKKITLAQKRGDIAEECCCAYGKCLVKTGGIFCVSAWMGNSALRLLLYGTGIIIVSYQCENELKYQNNIWPESQIKIALLEQINCQSSKNGPVITPNNKKVSGRDVVATLAHDASNYA